VQRAHKSSLANKAAIKSRGRGFVERKLSRLDRAEISAKLAANSTSWGEEMASAPQDRIKALTERMLKKKLYVVLSTPLDGGAEKLAGHLPAHLEYMIDNEKKGFLFASGPLSEADGGQRGRGLTILRASSAEEARRIAGQDPFVLNGVRTFEIREWTVMEGSFGVTVNFSDQSASIA
jgi:uncharacterized protein YciI